MMEEKFRVVEIEELSEAEMEAALQEDDERTPELVDQTGGHNHTTAFDLYAS